MITRQVEVKANPKEVAGLLFELDNIEVAQVFSEWKKLFDLEYQKRRESGKTIWIHDLNHFMLYVIDELDEDGKDLVRTMYSNLIYRLMDDIHKKHLLDII